MNKKEPTGRRQRLEKKAKKAAIAAATGASVVVGSLYDNPDELLQTQKEATDSQPVIASGDQQTETPQKPTLSQRLRSWIAGRPLWLRVAVGLPAWAAGSVIIAAAQGLWQLAVDPLLSRFGYWLIYAAVLVVLLVVLGKLLFPNLPVKKILNKKNLAILGIGLAAAVAADAFFTRCWPKYDAYSRSVLIAFAAISLICAGYQLYHDHHQTRLVVTSDGMTLEDPS